MVWSALLLGVHPRRMAGAEAEEAMNSSSPSASSSGDGTLIEDFSNSFFQCCVCLDLLYKPIVLACGHISCFWCVHKAMHGSRASYCALCRQPYKHFPSICQLLHFLLLKLEPAAYKRREKEVLEEEERMDIYSPQFVDHLISERVHSGEILKNNDSLKANKSEASKELTFPENRLENGICKQISMNDVLCALCKELLYQPVVLNCGHVFCESCLSSVVGDPLKCQVCQSLHPGEFPNICLDLDHFLEEQFPREYAMRRESVLLKVEHRHGDPSSSVLHTEKQSSKSSCNVPDDHLCLPEDLSSVHVGVGCDSCGMYPIIGKRYKCQDCKETIGFDLCEACYNTSSKLPGRFNQQHTPDHKFELDDTLLLYKILLFRAMPEEDPQQDVAEADLPDDDQQDHEDHDHVPEGNLNEDQIL